MKRMIAALLSLCALMCAAAIPALAAEQHYPIKVEEYTYGPLDELRIEKVYQLSLSDDPKGIPTEDFDRNGRHYYLLDLVRKDDVGVDTQPYTETATMDSDTGELSVILKRLDAERTVTTEDGYSGTLILDHTSVKVEVKGYKTSTRNLSATRSYPSLSDADLSLVPKTITENGKTLSLADVQWASDGTHYTATAQYTGTASNRYATGYTVTANYTGQVSKTNCEVVTYTAIFGSTKLEEQEPPATEPVADVDPPADVEIPDTAGSGTGWLPMVGCVGFGAVLTAVALMVILKLRERSKR